MLDTVVRELDPVLILSIIVLGITTGFVYTWFDLVVRRLVFPPIMIATIGLGFFLIILAESADTGDEAVAIVIARLILWIAMSFAVFGGILIAERAKKIVKRS